MLSNEESKRPASRTFSGGHHCSGRCCDAKAQCLGGYEVALGVENVVDGWVCGEKSLG
jgi:hypothetical protein